MFTSTLIALAACGAIQATTLHVSTHVPQTAQAITRDAGLNSATLEIGGLLSWGNGKVYDVARTPTSISQGIVRVVTGGRVGSRRRLLRLHDSRAKIARQRWP